MGGGKRKEGKDDVSVFSQDRVGLQRIFSRNQSTSTKLY